MRLRRLLQRSNKVWAFEKVRTVVKVTFRQAQGDNHSKRKRVFMIATISIKLFQTAISMVKEQKNA
jgi:hypothetical protein